MDGVRAGVLALVVCAVACDARNGTYLVVDGTANNLAFDRVEFFFGKHLGEEELVTAAAASGAAVPASVSLEKRQVAETDIHDEPSPVTELNYYLPLTPDNEKLGDYVVVIASKGGTPVGVAELEWFTIQGDAAYLYTLTLEPYPAVGLEVWGAPDRDCVRWTRARPGDPPNRPSTHAVVRDGDFDCDAIQRDADCDDLAYCPVGSTNTPACTRAALCVTETCDIGVCVSGAGTTARTCAPTTCLDPDLCGKCGFDDPTQATPRELLACAVEQPTTHPEVQMPLEASGALCGASYVVKVSVDGGAVCTNPKIEYPSNGTDADGFRYTIAPNAMTETACDITITAPQPGFPYPMPKHVIFTVAPTPPGALRRLTTVGFNHNTTRTCSSGYDVAYAVPPTYVCD